MISKADLFDEIQKIADKYDVVLCQVTRNIYGTWDIKLNENIYYKAQARMEEAIRKLGNIRDIYYRDVA